MKNLLKLDKQILKHLHKNIAKNYGQKHFTKEEKLKMNSDKDYNRVHYDTASFILKRGWSRKENGFDNSYCSMKQGFKKRIA